MAESGEMIGLAEAAIALRVPYQLVHRWLMVGRLQGQKTAGRWLVRGEDVARLAEELAAGRLRGPRSVEG